MNLKRISKKAIIIIFLVGGLCFCTFAVVYFKRYTYPVSDKLDQLHLTIGEDSYARLEKLRDRAIDIGRLIRSKSDYVPVTVEYNNTLSKGKIRLKGDWIDHLKSYKKWSFNLKLDSPIENGIKSFHIQNPESRSFLKEYVFHKLLLREGILSSEYKFVQVFLNGKSLGVYAFEENFSSRTIKNSNKPPGFIFKFRDNLFFEEIIKPESVEYKKIISNVKIKLINKDQKKNPERNDAQALMLKYQQRDSSVYADFDLEQMAKFYSLCDISKAYHAVGWINMRFYYNTLSNKMEPIGYDAYPGTGPLSWASPYLGYKKNHSLFKNWEHKSIVFDVFAENKMQERYEHYLTHYLDSNFILKFNKEIEEEINFYLKEIRNEYSWYNYESQFLYKNIADIMNAKMK